LIDKTVSYLIKKDLVIFYIYKKKRRETQRGDRKREKSQRKKHTRGRSKTKKRETRRGDRRRDEEVPK